MSRGLLLAVVGPTASGKSDLAVALATQLGAEVVNADSMQLYRGMDIGTAKLSVEQRRGVPHHLLDVWPVTRTATVAEYQDLAVQVVEEVVGRDVLPVLVGGSGLYVHAVTDRWKFPGTDQDVRAELEEELARVGAPAMHERLTRLDPDAAVNILATNGRRIVRALEVVRMQGTFTSRLPSHGAAADDPANDSAAPPGLPVRLVGLDVPREVLDVRIEERVSRMWEAGLVAEVERLVEQGLRDGLTASRALGYAQVLRHLDGELSEDETRLLTVRATRRFARKQDSWFRRDPRITWLPYDSPTLLADTRSVLEAASAPRLS
ncbi:MAG: tRNA (adenosine(37)-N6)-dimethylallyltransferase MiaA [Actinomycetes bacterium]